MSVGKFLAGCVIGGAVGAVAGVLLAPQSGEETRDLLSDASKDVAKKTDKTVKEIQDKADTVVSDLQKKSDEIMEKIQTLINKQKPEGAETAEGTEEND